MMRGFVVSHSNSTSNHNDSFLFYLFFPVVSHSNSTSNHNQSESRFLPIRLFLIPILHQTTTKNRLSFCHDSCFSFQFYIKPQPLVAAGFFGCRLFLIPILHQTTTMSGRKHIKMMLFLIPILHQTTTSRMAVIHILHVTHMTPMHKTSCRTPGKLVGCNFVFQRAIYQKNSSC